MKDVKEEPVGESRSNDHHLSLSLGIGRWVVSLHRVVHLRRARCGMIR